MSLVNTKTVVKAAISCTDRKSVSGQPSAEIKPSETHSATPNAVTYNRVLTSYGTLNANANTDIDLYSFTSNLGESVTATKALSLLVTANASTTGGKLRLSPSTTNGIAFWLGGTTPTLTLNVGTTEAAIMLSAGTSETLNTTSRNINLNNPGNVAVTYTTVIILGD